MQSLSNLDENWHQKHFWSDESKNDTYYLRKRFLPPLGVGGLGWVGGGGGTSNTHLKGPPILYIYPTVYSRGPYIVCILLKFLKMA